MLQKRSLYWIENGHTEVALWTENGHFTEVLTLMEGQWSCYGGGQFKGGITLSRNGHRTKIIYTYVHHDRKTTI